MNAPELTPAAPPPAAAAPKPYETCLVCMGKGRLPYVAIDRFTGASRLTTAPCCRCHGCGRVAHN